MTHGRMIIRIQMYWKMIKLIFLTIEVCITKLLSVFMTYDMMIMDVNVIEVQ